VRSLVVIGKPPGLGAKRVLDALHGGERCRRAYAGVGGVSRY
jgi:hypothetical protein